MPFILIGGIVTLLVGCERVAAPQQQAPDAAAVDAALRAAESYLNTDELVKAETVLAVLVEKAPDEQRAHEMLGHVLTQRAIRDERRGDFDAARTRRADAFAHYERATELPPSSAGLHQSAGVVGMLAGERAAALDHFREAARLDPASVQAPLYAAQVLLQERETTEARRHLEHVLTLDPDEPLAHASLAICAMEEGHFDQALDAIREARAIAPADLRFRIQEARVLRRSGDPAAAVELLVSLDDRQRTDVGVTTELAASLGELGEHRRVAAAWIACFERDPAAADAYLAATRAAEAFLVAGDEPAARRWWEHAALRAPEASEVRRVAELLEG